MQRYIGEIIRTHQKGKSPQAKAEDQVLGYQIEYWHGESAKKSTEKGVWPRRSR